MPTAASSRSALRGDDGRVLAAQFQDGRAHVFALGKGAEDAHAHIIGAGEGDPIHIWAVDQRLAHSASRGR